MTVTQQKQHILSKFLLEHYKLASWVECSPGDLGSIPGGVILIMVLDTSLLNTQQYKIRIKGKM